MRKTWATSSLDLHLDARGPGVRAGLEAALREAVRTGRLAAGTRLPSSRALAEDLGIARNTVTEVYAQLVAEGWLTARQGSGTSVADAVPAVLAPAGPRPETPPPMTPSPARPGKDQRFGLDMRAGFPDLSAFPRSAWLAAGRRALTGAPSRALGYGDPRGLPELRTVLAGYLARTRGVRADPDRIVVCNGFTQGLGLLCQVLRDRGASMVALEEYGQLDPLQTIAASALAPALLPVDDDGAVLDSLTEAAARAQALILTPAHQFPLGSVLSPARRVRAARWAAETGGVIIEDDYDGEFRYDRQQVGALQALAPEHVVYAGTASKSLAPGLRLGWLVLPAGLVAEVAAAKSLADAHTGTFEQLTLAEFITSGSYDRHVRSSRLAYRRRRDLLLARLAERVPGVRVTGIAAGLHAIAELPAGLAEDKVIARATRLGLTLTGLGSFTRTGAGLLSPEPPRRDPDRHAKGPALVIGYAAPPGHSYSVALDRLCSAITGG